MRRARMKSCQRREILKLATEAARGGNPDLADELRAVVGELQVSPDWRPRGQE